MTESYPAEQWAPITGFESLYEVSTRGQVRALERIVIANCAGRPHTRKYRGRIIAQGVNTPRREGAYTRKQVTLRKNNKAYTFNVARLVATAFVQNLNNLPFVLHLDDDATNNNVENLEWGDHAENVRQAADRYRCSYGQRHHSAVLSDVSRRLAWELLRDGSSVKEVARHFNLHHQIISDINQGKCKGFPALKKPKQPLRGSASPRSKLNESQVIQIKQLLTLGLKQKEVAERFGVGQTTVAAISTGTNWGWLRAD
jgi:transposase